MSTDRFTINCDDGGVFISHPFAANMTSQEICRGAICQQAADLAALKDALADEVSANEAFRRAGGARDDEDMPTFCARLLSDFASMTKARDDLGAHLDQFIAERDKLRSDLAAVTAERDRLAERLARPGHAHLDGAHSERDDDGCLLCRIVAERDQLRTRLAEIEKAPTVAVVVELSHMRDTWRQINYDENDLPEAGTELIARLKVQK